MATITEALVGNSYRVAKAFYLEQVTQADAVAELKAAGMNPSSAKDYVRNFRQMMRGARYERTLSNYATEYYLGQILADFGLVAAANALGSVRQHIRYYESLGRGRLLGLALACDAFEEKIEQFRQSAAVQDEFERAVEQSRRLTPAERTAASAAFSRRPKRIAVTTQAYVRNPHVVATVLERAAGKCEECGGPAPFNRASNGTPYLEVHHKLRLAAGGDDTVENAVAVCPNCHRRAHYG